MTRLSLALLGPMQIALGGQPVGGFTYNKARALLAYLAVEAGRPHQRDALATLLWPDMPDEAARHNLRQTLVNLRTALGDATATPPFLHITRDTIQFNPGSDDDLDVSTFTALLTACESHAHRHLERCRSCAARMEQAISLYRGDFLAGFSVGDSAPFEEWQLRQRERLHQRALDAFVQLADYHERHCDDELARRYAQRQIELEPWREEAYRQLMRLLARGGQRSAALAQYETCRRILARDLGVEPESETTALYAHIRDGSGAEVPASKRTTQRTPSTQNFPAQTTLLIGRQTELAELGALLENPACRLMTIVGPGGIGKTRLALAAAAEQAEVFTHGAVFVPLQAISSAAFLAPAILLALDVPLQGQRDPREQLVDYLRGKELLLVLDNFEQLLAPELIENEGGARLLVEMLQHAPGVTLLVTSRERLALHGEWLFDLLGLSYPASQTINGIGGYGAVQLFVQRAGQVRRQVALADAEARAVARICRLVEGLPLAIELAAAAMRTRSCAAIADAIENNLSPLAVELRGVPERHRSIWAAFEHSWRLLLEEERQVLPRLSVFRGGFEEAAAAQVAQATPKILAALVDKSLLRWDSLGRYDMHELVRQFANEKLEQVEAALETRQQHGAYFLTLAERADPELRGPQQQVWLTRLEAEHDNLRAAFHWFEMQCPDASQVARLVGALWRFWFTRGHLSEGQACLERALRMFYSRSQMFQVKSETSEQSPIQEPPSQMALRARLLLGAGWLAIGQGDFQHAKTLFEASRALFRECVDVRGIADALNGLGYIAVAQEDSAQACALFEENLALCREYGYRQGAADALLYLGHTHNIQGDRATARVRTEEGLALFRELGDKNSIADALQNLGWIALYQGDHARVAPLYEEALALHRELGAKEGVASDLWRLGRLAEIQGDYRRAVALCEESLALSRESGDRHAIAMTLGSAAEMALALGDVARAEASAVESLTLSRAFNYQEGIVHALYRMCTVAAVVGQLERAARLLGAADALLERIDLRFERFGFEKINHDHAIAAVRAQLGEEAFVTAWTAGREMPVEQAIDEALGRSASEAAKTNAS